MRQEELAAEEAAAVAAATQASLCSPRSYTHAEALSFKYWATGRWAKPRATRSFRVYSLG